MRPELTELSQALLAITPAKRREAKPEIALRDARRTAMALLQAWPETEGLSIGEIPQKLLGSSVRVLRPDHHRVLGPEAALGLFDSVKVETRDLTVQIMRRGDRTEVTVNPEGGPGAHHVSIEDVSLNSIQARLTVKGID